jgi:hypothetical protein
MGEPEDEDDVPEHYFCEECRPEEHTETLAAIARGEKIWEVRAHQHRQWKKMSSQRRKSKGKGGEEARPTWLKKLPEEVETAGGMPPDAQETGTKRKREAVKVEIEQQEAHPSTEDKPIPQSRPDKRRKSTHTPGKGVVDVSTAVVNVEQLPTERRRIAENFSKIIADDLQARAKAGGYRIHDGQTPRSLGDKYGGLIEYSLFMNHGDPKNEKYKEQVRNLSPNLKRNKTLIERLLDGSLTPDELSLMSSQDMLSEERQREQQKLKEELDRQAMAVENVGPTYRQSHKGIEMVEDERHQASDYASNPAPVRERASIAEDGSPVPAPTAASLTEPAAPEVKRPSDLTIDRRPSSQQNFDMNAIWSKTAQSPTTASAQAPRPMQMPPRRRSSVIQPVQQNGGAKEDPDVDRLLQDDDEDYSPAEAIGDETIVWRGKLMHETVGEPTVNARFVAGRDLAPTLAWRELLPPNLNIDGRLQVGKAEEYLCGLQWSQTSDVSVLAFTPYDNAASFNKVFDYFITRTRYAVVNKDKPLMVKDLYIIPLEVGASLPDHIEKLEYCTIKTPVEERVLLATMVVQRAAQTPPVAQPQGANGNGQPQGYGGLPQHLRNGGQGPSASPLNTQGPTFPPATQAQLTPTAYGAQPVQQQPGQIPPNPYGPQAIEQQQNPAYPPPQHQQPHPQQQPPMPYQQSPPPPYGQPGAGVAPQQSQQGAAPSATPQALEILGPFAYAPVAQEIFSTDPNPSVDKLKHLRSIFESNVAARTSIDALAAELRVNPITGAH